jgi:glycerol-3-phosphate dehydrogenase
MGRNHHWRSGLGTALDAASRGYKTILVEAVDFAKGTSRSTKLVHGGVRYLEQVTSLLLKRLLEINGSKWTFVKNQSLLYLTTIGGVAILHHRTYYL